MPNLVSRLARFILRSRKRSASMRSPAVAPQSSSISQKEAPSLPNEDEHESDVGASVNHAPAEPATLKGIDSSTASGNEVKMQTAVIKMPNEIQQSSAVRTRRVLCELRNVMKSSEDSDSPFKISLVDEDNIFEWDIKLLKVDEASDLWRSMQQTNTESINFRLKFPKLFPFQPPFLRLVGPYLDNGFIMDGGAICMEVLTAQGWSSAYTIEALLVQVASGLTQGGAVISGRQKRRYNRLTERRAEIEFRRICKIHAKYGWVRDDL